MSILTKAFQKARGGSPSAQKAPARLSETQPSTRAIEPGQIVFEINFLRHPAPSAAIQQGLFVLGAIYLLANVVVTGWLLFTGVSAAWNTVRSESRASSRSAAAQDLGVLYQRANQELVQLQGIVDSQRARFLAGGRLAALTETLPARTWISGISGDRAEHSIILRAEYLIDPDHPYEVPARDWMETLRADPRFGNGLKKLDMASSSRRTQGNAELLSFELVAEWNAD